LPYNYVIQPRKQGRRFKWQLRHVKPDGKTEFVQSYDSRGTAISTARILAGDRGKIGVMR
jgi:hypothetical protein